MPDLFLRKVGLIACSGEELPEGTISRIAARLVLEELRPLHTVTLCLPLFLAGGEAEHSFARHQPTITIDGCEKLCARRATQRHSGQVAASFIVSEFVDYYGLTPPKNLRNLSDAELALSRTIAEAVATEVDRLIEAQRQGMLAMTSVSQAASEGKAMCACQSGPPPAQELETAKGRVHVVALDAILAQFARARYLPNETTAREMLALVKVYNSVPRDAEEDYVTALLRAYQVYLARQGQQV